MSQGRSTPGHGCISELIQPSAGCFPQPQLSSATPFFMPSLSIVALLNGPGAAVAARFVGTGRACRFRTATTVPGAMAFVLLRRLEPRAQTVYSRTEYSRTRSDAMHYRALAVDYDGTLAGEGRGAPATFQALQRLADKGCTLLLVTGRELGELKEVFPGLGVFHGVVAENGALLYRPSDQHCRRLGPAPPPSFLAALAERGVPFSAGSSIVATVQ